MSDENALAPLAAAEPEGDASPDAVFDTDAPEVLDMPDGCDVWDTVAGAEGTELEEAGALAGAELLEAEEGAEEPGGGPEEVDGAPLDGGITTAEPLPGGGTAWEGSVSAPMPQGTAEPSGSVAFGAGTLLPDASAIVKRVVHCVSEEAGDVNW
jgi:hypothetical protein